MCRTLTLFADDRHAIPSRDRGAEEPRHIRVRLSCVEHDEVPVPTVGGLVPPHASRWIGNFSRREEMHWTVGNELGFDRLVMLRVRAQATGEVVGFLLHE